MGPNLMRREPCRTLHSGMQNEECRMKNEECIVTRPEDIPHSAFGKRVVHCANFCFQRPRAAIYGYISERGLRRLWLPSNGAMSRWDLECAADVRLEARLREALRDYFSGREVGFSEIPLDLEGATPFRREVWMAARKVPWGKTASYAGLAGLIGRTRGAARAVGQALGANPVPIVVPCHRITAADGTLGGFSAGLEWKRELLRLEGHSAAGR